MTIQPGAVSGGPIPGTWPGAPAPSSGPGAGKVLAIVLAVMLVIGSLVAWGVWRTFSDFAEQVPGGADTLFGELEPGETYGDNPRLDALWDGCAAGAFADCDELYFVSGLGTGYERFGDSCGERNEPAGLCTEIHGQ